MEFAAVIVFIFVLAIIAVMISVPLLIISKVMQVVQKSFNKLFRTAAPKA